MKVQYYQNSIYQQNFSAGLNRNIINAAQNCDVNLISGLLYEKGIVNNFQGDKVRAFCSMKIIELIDTLNRNFHLDFCYPNAIITGDLTNHFGRPNTFGFCTFTPIKSKSGFICPEKTIFFNQSKTDVKEELEILDRIAEIDYQKRFNSSDNFMVNFIHEFAHAIHEGNLLKKNSAWNVNKKLQLWSTDKFNAEYNHKFSNYISEICEYAKTNLLDTLACDLSGRLGNSLNKNLTIENNIFKNTAYESQNIIKRIKRVFVTDKIQSKNDLIYAIWNGNI